MFNFLKGGDGGGGSDPPASDAGGTGSMLLNMLGLGDVAQAMQSGEFQKHLTAFAQAMRDIDERTKRIEARLESLTGPVGPGTMAGVVNESGGEQRPLQRTRAARIEADAHARVGDHEQVEGGE